MLAIRCNLRLFIHSLPEVGGEKARLLAVKYRSTGRWNGSTLCGVDWPLFSVFHIVDTQLLLMSSSVPTALITFPSRSTPCPTECWLGRVDDCVDDCVAVRSDLDARGQALKRG